MLRGSVASIPLRKKLLTLASVAVLLPLGILTYIQYRSLVELENKTKEATKENLRQGVLNIQRRVEARLTQVAELTLTQIGNVKLSSPDTAAQLEAQLALVKQSHPEVEQLFMFSHCGCETPKDSYGYVYADKLLKLETSEFGTNRTAHHALLSFDKARTSQNFVDSSRKFLFGQWSCSGCPNKQVDSYIFYPLADGNQTVFAGAVLSDTYVRDHLLAASISEALHSSDSPLNNSDAAISIRDENQGELYTNSPSQQEYGLESSFARPFSNWNARIGFKNGNIESLARKSFWQGFMITLLVLTVLLAGIALTIRATNREVSLAQAKTSFVANVSHELKTPISLLNLFAEILELGRVNDEGKKQEYYRIIRHESRRLDKLIDNVLDFSKIEAGRKEYNFGYADLVPIVESVLADHRYEIVNSRVAITTEFQEDLPPVLIDRDAISQAVSNLLDNAIKYSPDVKKISISVRSDNGHTAIEVADRGMGIPRSEQPKIFEKFYRVGNGLVHDVKGSGLGLSLVKHIIHAHQGTISVESEVGNGSRFTILLPVSPKPAEQG